MFNAKPQSIALHCHYFRNLAKRKVEVGAGRK